MLLLSYRIIRWLFMLLVLVLILSISFVSRSRQEHGDNAHYLNIKNSQVQRPDVRGRHHDENPIALEGPRARKDSLKHTIDSKTLPHHFRHLHKRAVNPQVWSEYVCKGEKLLALMAMSTEQATASLGFASESTFTNYADLDTNGWSLYDRSANFDLRNLNIGNVFNDLQLDGMSGGPLDLRFKNRVAAWSQDEKYTVNGVEQNPSNAQYINTFNPTQGLIGAWSNYGPAYQLRNYPTAVLPSLKQWSDVAFLEWKNQLEMARMTSTSDARIPAPRMILRINMMNVETLNLIDQILRNLPAAERPLGPAAWGVPTPPWSDRKVFNMDTDAGKVLLGSPNGRGVAWLLLQHKRAFGLKTITSAVVFKEGGG
ncbi:hypothetical protein EG327_008269 [Venturia inaequalis]|uniref:Uncharacterized protein n=1 Tax=Venturia inaequalis TaxID=5025 RepID=A0A8H3VRV3_VENIN|nr:hypothetical protein EG327_008269 [Venturia inaequalis]